jgi:hypothetical protein
MEEREGCPIKRGALPGVSAHDAETSSVRLVVRDVHGIEIGLNPAWLEIGGDALLDARVLEAFSLSFAVPLDGPARGERAVRLYYRPDVALSLRQPRAHDWACSGVPNGFRGQTEGVTR